MSVLQSVLTCKCRLKLKNKYIISNVATDLTILRAKLMLFKEGDTACKSRPKLYPNPLVCSDVSFPFHLNHWGFALDAASALSPEQVCIPLLDPAAFLRFMQYTDLATIPCPLGHKELSHWDPVLKARHLPREN